MNWIVRIAFVGIGLMGFAIVITMLALLLPPSIDAPTPSGHGNNYEAFYNRSDHEQRIVLEFMQKHGLETLRITVSEWTNLETIKVTGWRAAQYGVKLHIALEASSAERRIAQLSTDQYIAAVELLDDRDARTQISHCVVAERIKFIIHSIPVASTRWDCPFIDWFVINTVDNPSLRQDTFLRRWSHIEKSAVVIWSAQDESDARRALDLLQALSLRWIFTRFAPSDVWYHSVLYQLFFLRL